MLSLDFDEAEHIESDKPEDVQQSQRTIFMNFVTHHFATQSLQIDIWKMSLKMSRPHGYVHEIHQFILFSIYVRVKHLEFNFDDPKWQQNGAILFTLPDAVYHENDNLEYLKLRWCHLDFTRKCELAFLKDLTLERCVGMDWLWMSNPSSGTSMLNDLVLDRCWNSSYIRIRGPKLRTFVYSGKVVEFFLENQTRLIEVRLDFWMQDKLERLGYCLFYLMRQLIDVRSMTVCSAFLQIIATENYIADPELYLKLQHLSLNTSVHETEFIGIKFMLANSPQMETLTLCIVPRKIFNEYVAPIPFISDPADFWQWTLIAETCLTTSLKELNVRGFEGSFNEMCLIQYIMSMGSCLQSVKLFLVPMQEDDHAKREDLESKCNSLMQSFKGNPNLVISVV